MYFLAFGSTGHIRTRETGTEGAQERALQEGCTDATAE